MSDDIINILHKKESLQRVDSQQLEKLIPISFCCEFNNLHIELN